MKSGTKNILLLVVLLMFPGIVIFLFDKMGQLDGILFTLLFFVFYYIAVGCYFIIGRKISRLLLFIAIFLANLNGICCRREGWYHLMQVFNGIDSDANQELTFFLILSNTMIFAGLAIFLWLNFMFHREEKKHAVDLFAETEKTTAE